MGINELTPEQRQKIRASQVPLTDESIEMLENLLRVRPFQNALRAWVKINKANPSFSLKRGILEEPTEVKRHVPRESTLRKIMELVEKYPGVTATEIRERSGMGTSAIQEGIKVFLVEGAIYRARRNKKLKIYSISAGVEQPKCQYLELIQKHPGITSKEIVSITGVSRSKVWRILKNYVRRGYVYRVNASEKTSLQAYFLADAGLEYLGVVA